MAATDGAIEAVQTAIYATLSADATLLALATGGILNYVPPGNAYPYVLISKPTETPWHQFGGFAAGLGWKVIARVHTYSRYEGDQEALDIHGRIVTLLNKWNSGPSVSGFSSAIWEYEQARPMVEAIDKIETRHIVGEFCVRVQQ